MYSTISEKLLLISDSAVAKIINKDGKEVNETLRGDMYMRDMKGTKGHISSITSGDWHPTKPNVIVTAAMDSTVR